jgi:hypothetical protein
LLAMWALHPLKSAALSRQQYCSNRLVTSNYFNILSEPTEEAIQKLPNIAENKKRT